MSKIQRRRNFTVQDVRNQRVAIVSKSTMAIMIAAKLSRTCMTDGQKAWEFISVLIADVRFKKMEDVHIWTVASAPTHGVGHADLNQKAGSIHYRLKFLAGYLMPSMISKRYH